MLHCLFLKEIFFQRKFATLFVPIRQVWFNVSLPYQTVGKVGGGADLHSWRRKQQRACRIVRLSTSPVLRGITQYTINPSCGEITCVITELTKFETGHFSSLLSAHWYCLGGPRGRGVRGGGGVERERGSEDKRGSGRLVFLYRALQ